MKSQVSVRSQVSEDTKDSRTSSRSSATPPPPPPRARRSSSVQSGSSSGTPLLGPHTAPLRLTTTLTEETSPQRVKRRNKPLPQITPNIQTNMENIQTRRTRENKINKS